MVTIETIVRDLRQVRDYGNDMLAHVDPEIWFRQPAPGMNHIAWQVGHLAIVEYSLCLKRIRGERPSDVSLFPTQEYARLFGKGSIPSSSPSDYPTPTEIRQSYDAVHAQTLLETEQIDASDLDASCGPPHPMFSTKGEALQFCPKHEMLHIGQIAMLRRLFGADSLR